MAEKFEFGGGKALPDEMTGPVMAIPSEARWKASEAKRIAAVVRRRKGLPDNDDGFAEPGGGGGGDCTPAATMFDQVCIFYRTHYSNDYFSISHLTNMQRLFQKYHQH